MVDNKKIECTFSEVLYVPEVRKNLLSVKKLIEKGVKIKFEQKAIKIYKDRNLVITGKMANLYEVVFEVPQVACYHVSNENEI